MTDVRDVLLKRYGDMSYILSLPADEGIALIFKAYEKEQEDRLWQQWLVDPRGKSFDRFLREARARMQAEAARMFTPDRSPEALRALIKDAERIRQAHQKGGSP